MAYLQPLNAISIFFRKVIDEAVNLTTSQSIPAASEAPQTVLLNEENSIQFSEWNDQGVIWHDVESQRFAQKSYYMNNDFLAASRFLFDNKRQKPGENGIYNTPPMLAESRLKEFDKEWYAVNFCASKHQRSMCNEAYMVQHRLLNKDEDIDNWNDTITSCNSSEISIIRADSDSDLKFLAAQLSKSPSFSCTTQTLVGDHETQLYRVETSKKGTFFESLMEMCTFVKHSIECSGVEWLNGVKLYVPVAESGDLLYFLKDFVPCDLKMLKNAALEGSMIPIVIGCAPIFCRMVGQFLMSIPEVILPAVSVEAAAAGATVGIEAATSVSILGTCATVATWVIFAGGCLYAVVKFGHLIDKARSDKFACSSENTICIIEWKPAEIITNDLA